IASHIGDEQMPLVEHADETWLAALRGGIAMPCLTAGGHNHEWRVADEVLDIGGHILLYLSNRSPIRGGVTKFFSKTIRFNSYCHDASFSCTRCMSAWAVIVCRKALAGRCSLGTCHTLEQQLTGLQALRQDVRLSRARHHDAMRKRGSIAAMLR